MKIKVKYEKGVFKPLKKVDLKEGTLGIIEIPKNILDFFGKDILDEKMVKNLEKDWDKWAKRYA
ncbi:MAG: antitoxin family protein [Euryarchaeota archaeon]|nr:antitoxin family protein [Euryarchaeota archaeon]